MIVDVLCATTIQLLDAILHYSLNNGLTTVERFISRFLVPCVLILEIIIAYWAGVHYVGFRNTWYEVILGIYVIGFLWLWIPYCLKPTVKTPSGFLRWCDDVAPQSGLWLFIIFLFAPFVMYYRNSIEKYIFLGTLAATFAWNYNHDPWGSRWCHSFNIFSVLFLLTKGVN